MAIRNNPGFGLIFATRRDRLKHEQNHCGNEIPKYNNNSANGIVDRRTPYVFGTPKGDMRTSKDKVMFGETTNQWLSLISNYKRGRYKWYQVFGHVAAAHGYASRTPSERWGIALCGQYQEPIAEIPTPTPMKSKYIP